jgi:hypothetical protein
LYRADSVKDYLVKKGVAAERIETRRRPRRADRGQQDQGRQEELPSSSLLRSDPAEPGGARWSGADRRPLKSLYDADDTQDAVLVALPGDDRLD